MRWIFANMTQALGFMLWASGSGLQALGFRLWVLNLRTCRKCKHLD
jgi:hypothetical protein